MFIFILIFSTAFCTATSQEFVNFQTALQQWRSQKTKPNLVNLMHKYETIRFDTLHPRWLQMAREDAAYYGIDIEKLYQDYISEREQPATCPAPPVQHSPTQPPPAIVTPPTQPPATVTPVVPPPTIPQPPQPPAVPQDPAPPQQPNDQPPTVPTPPAQPTDPLPEPPAPPDGPAEPSNPPVDPQPSPQPDPGIDPLPTTTVHVPEEPPTCEPAEDEAEFCIGGFIESLFKSMDNEYKKNTQDFSGVSLVIFVF